MDAILRRPLLIFASSSAISNAMVDQFLADRKWDVVKQQKIQELNIALGKRA
jgi:hypothetical protein